MGGAGGGWRSRVGSGTSTASCTSGAVVSVTGGEPDGSAGGSRSAGRTLRRTVSGSPFAGPPSFDSSTPGADGIFSTRAPRSSVALRSRTPGRTTGGGSVTASGVGRSMDGSSGSVVPTIAGFVFSGGVGATGVVGVIGVLGLSVLGGGRSQPVAGTGR